MNRSAKLWLLLMVTVGSSAWAWWLWRSPPPNILLITVDTLRPDHLSAYGYDKHRTPNFDRLAQEGVLFENAFCDVTWTIPSMASVMTGQYATRHGMRSSSQQLNPAMTTVAETLRAGGMHTAAIVGSYPLASVFGFDQGFDLYDDRFSLPLLNQSVANAREWEPTERPVAGGGGTELTRAQLGQFIVNKVTHDAYRPDNEVSDRAIQWLSVERKQPFFLWVHYFGPHEKPRPTDTPANPVEQLEMELGLYDPDIVNSDTQLGRLLTALDALGLAHRTAVILHADHGQSLNEHNYFGHGRNVYDPSQHIPLLIRFPGRVPAGRRVDRLVRNVDLFPTMAELMDKTAPAPLDGISLVPLMCGDQPDGKEEVYVETYLSALSFLSELVEPSKHIRLGFRHLGVRTPQWKFIMNDPVEFIDIDNPPPVTAEQRSQYHSEELYDLRTDPGESQNVVNQHPETAKALRARVMDYQNVRGVERDRIKLDEASRERLRSLGYLVD